LKKVSGFVLALAMILIMPAPAQAHAQLVAANPRISAVLTTAPKKVTLTFDDDLIPLAGSNVILVQNAKGVPVSSGATSLTAATIQVSLVPKLPLGVYKVTYRVLSADGHPVSNSYYFYIRKK
jgi:methionine-rich copper-binding protein CopC